MTEELVLTENNWLYFKQSNVFTVKKKGGGAARICSLFTVLQRTIFQKSHL